MRNGMKLLSYPKEMDCDDRILSNFMLSKDFLR